MSPKQDPRILWLHQDYFAQKDQWLRERKELEERTARGLEALCFYQPLVFKCGGLRFFGARRVLDIRVVLCVLFFVLYF